MSENLKDIFFTDGFIKRLGTAIQDVYPHFDVDQFFTLIHDGEWENRALKAMMRHITICLHELLPLEFPQALDILIAVGPNFNGFDAMIFPDYIECYGMDYFDLSMEALKFFTPLCSSEFAVRPFITNDPNRAMTYMIDWADDKSEHVRRLSSEGCRPRLPWAMALNVFKADPSPILPILEKLKDDQSDYVRRSVANNLNDISKDHPDVVLDICDRWFGKSPQVDWVVKHACRGLLKAGDRRAMVLFGFSDPEHIHVRNLALDKEKLRIGDAVRFTFELLVDDQNTSRVRLEYAVDYVKSRGKVSRKIFQISERTYSPGEHIISKAHSFIDRSTRRHYPGVHKITIIVNGLDKVDISINLLESTEQL